MSKLYVLIRKDMSPSYQAVQAGHAVAQWLVDGGQGWRNGTLVYLGVDDEQALERWQHKLTCKGMGFSVFREPDIDNQLTAIACLTDSKVFAHLRLI